MNGLIPFGIFILFGIVAYLFYNAGLFDDIINWIKTQYDSIKMPEIDLFGKKEKERQRLAEIERQRILEEESRKTRESARPKKKPRPADNRRSSKGERITEWELGYLWDGIYNRRRVPCFNCLNADMYTGSNNVLWYCPNCGQGINLQITNGTKEGVICENLGIDKSKIQ